MAKNYAKYSFWLETCGDDLTPRPALDGSTDVDVAIMGAGFTGLWTAYHLLRRDPSLNVLVVEKEIAGFGASSLQFNDQSIGGWGETIDADGYTWSAALGGGLEYFLTDSVAFNLEGKYLWSNPIDITIDGRAQELDMSAPMVTFGFRVFLDDNHVRPGE